VLGFKRQGYGPLRIKQKLKAKGIAEDLINKALEQNLDTEEQIQICRRVLVKRIKTSSVGLERPQMREKMYRFLFNRGFAADTIQQVIAAQAEQT
jgi:regulatory protein